MYLLVIGIKLASSLSLTLTVTNHKILHMCVKAILKKPVSLSFGKKINSNFHPSLPNLSSFLPPSRAESTFSYSLCLSRLHE